MSDKELLDKFGVSEGELEQRASEYEADDWSAMRFGAPSRGRPRLCDEKMDVLTFKAPHSLAQALGQAAKQLGVSRSEWCRRAIAEKLSAEN